MEELLKQVIRNTRDVVCERSNTLMVEAKASFRQTGDKVAELGRYVGLDDEKVHKFMETVAVYRAKYEPEYNIRIDVILPHVFLNSKIQRMLQEQSLPSNFFFASKGYRNLTLSENAITRKGFSCHRINYENTGRRQVLLSAIVWNCMRNDDLSYGTAASDGTVNKTRSEDEKIRKWNKRIDEVDVVRKCGTPSHLNLGSEDKQRALERHVDREDVRTQEKDSYIIKKLKQKCGELKRMLNSRKKESIKLADRKNDVNRNIKHPMDREMDMSYNSTASVSPKVSKRTKEKCNKKQLLSEMDEEEDEDVNDSDNDDKDSGTLTLQIPANVKRIILIKNGCRISVEV